ncbi:MAG: dienelactone hydrolase family protein [Desulfarculus sp.]|nr:dienelactone hydrolase family protein [Desulfarculus sp.]
MQRFRLALLLIVAGLVLASQALAAEMLQISSHTPRDLAQFLDANSARPQVTITGDLSLPGNASGKVPAMVIVHGSGGVTDRREGEWARRLNQAGIAALVIDSFRPRGIGDTATNQGKLSIWANVADALAALRVLAADSRIDPNKIGIMGFSRGGRVVLLTALEPIVRVMVPPPLRFAIHVPLYPSCNLRYISNQPTGAPLSMHLGETDDYTPAAPCLDYAQWFQSKGVPASATVYPGAGHGFDLPTEPRWLASAATGRGCLVEGDLDTLTWKVLATGQTLSSEAEVMAYNRKCGSRGATFGGNPVARQQVFENVLGVLREAFR